MSTFMYKVKTVIKIRYKCTTAIKSIVKMIYRLNWKKEPALSRSSKKCALNRNERKQFANIVQKIMKRSV